MSVARGKDLLRGRVERRGSCAKNEVSVVVFVAKSLSIAASCLNERMNPVRFEPGWARIRSNVRNDNIIVR